MRGFDSFGVLDILWGNSRPQRWRGVVSPCVTKHGQRRWCALAAAQLVSPACRRTSPVPDSSSHRLLCNPVALTVSPFWTQGALCTQDGLPVSDVCFLGEGKQELGDQVLATKRKISVGPKPNKRWKKKKKKDCIFTIRSFQTVKQGPPLYHGPCNTLQVHLSRAVSFVWQFY